MMCLATWKPVSALTVVAQEDVDGARLDQAAQLAVDRGDPDPYPLGFQFGAQVAVQFGHAQKSVSRAEDREERPLARRFTCPGRGPPSVAAGPIGTASVNGPAL